jgi:hypothetical protein
MKTKIYNLKDIVLSGKYKGETIQNLMNIDIQYVICLIEEQKIELDNEAFEYYQTKIDSEIGELS